MRNRHSLARGTAVLAFVATIASGPVARADEYDVTVVFKDEAPVMVPFLRCERNGVIIATDEAPATCRREVDVTRTFSVKAARITNVGTGNVFLHIGTARLAIPPGKHFRRTLPGGASFSRVFLSGEPGARAHVFVANPIEDEPEPPASARKQDSGD